MASLKIQTCDMNQLEGWSWQMNLTGRTATLRKGENACEAILCSVGPGARRCFVISCLNVADELPRYES